jgi:hypothetical protein
VARHLNSIVHIPAAGDELEQWRVGTPLGEFRVAQDPGDDEWPYMIYWPGRSDYDDACRTHLRALMLICREVKDAHAKH